MTRYFGAEGNLLEETGPHNTQSESSAREAESHTQVPGTEGTIHRHREKSPVEGVGAGDVPWSQMFCGFREG